MIAEQWTSSSGYGYGNQIQSVIAANSTITGTGDGYGELGPSWDLQDAFTAEGDSIRRHGTIMLGGDFYSEITKSAGGYTVPYSINSQGVHAAMKKYVIGTPTDNNNETAAQAASNNTYLLRYADVYLIEAEAIMGAASGVAAGTGIPMSFTSTDPNVLKYVNLIRQRAGLAALPSVSYQQLLNERRLEFAIEGEYWYDLQRIDGFNGCAPSDRHCNHLGPEPRKLHQRGHRADVYRLYADDCNRHPHGCAIFNSTSSNGIDCRSRYYYNHRFLTNSKTFYKKHRRMKK